MRLGQSGTPVPTDLWVVVRMCITARAYIIWTRHREEQAPPLPSLWEFVRVCVTQRNKKPSLVREGGPLAVDE